MPALKIGIQLAGLRLPLRKALVVAARLGATGVELDARGEIKPRDLGQTGLRELRRLLEEVGLKAVAVSFRTRRGYEVADELERRVAATKEAMKLAADLRAPVVINQFGRVPSESEGASWNLLMQSLNDLSAYGQHIGATLIAQTGAEPVADLKRLLDAAPQDGLGVNLDPGQLIINDYSPLDAARTLGTRILHVTARDAVRDFARGRGIETPLGRGAADFPALLGALEEIPYRGYFTIGRDEAADPVAEFEQTVSYLKSL